MNYSEMSDFELDKAVAEAAGIEYDEQIMFISPVDKINGNHAEMYIRKKITSNERHWKRFSPTSCWADAGRLIEDFKICIAADVFAEPQDGGCWVAQPAYGWDSERVRHDNPRRAAMIVFLMMQEQK